MARNLVNLVAYVKGSGGQVDPALTTWLTTLSARSREKLVAIGLLPADRVASAKPLADHLADWRTVLQSKGNSTQHVAETTARVQRIIDGCGFRFYADISGSRLAAWLHDLRTPTAEKKDISAATFNHLVGSFKAFCRWIVKDRRAAESPVAHLDALNVKTDRRHDRRALTVDELVKLPAATCRGPDRKRMTGPERAMLYRLALETGLRAGELRSLTRASFDLDGEQPTVADSAEYS